MLYDKKFKNNRNLNATRELDVIVDYAVRDCESKLF